MQEHQSRRSGGGRRRALWIAAAILVVFGGGVASYAATDGWNIWPWTLSIDSEGTVTDESGEVVGVTLENDDGSSTTYIQMGEGHIEVQALQSEESLKGKDIRLFVEP